MGGRGDRTRRAVFVVAGDASARARYASHQTLLDLLEVDLVVVVQDLEGDARGSNRVQERATARDGRGQDAAFERKRVSFRREQEHHLDGQSRGLVVSVPGGDLRADGRAVPGVRVEMILREQLGAGFLVEALTELEELSLRLELLLLFLRARVGLRHGLRGLLGREQQVLAEVHLSTHRLRAEV